MNLALYKVADHYLRACEDLRECAELPQQAIADTLESLSGDVEHKALNIAAYYKNLQAEIADMKEYETDMRLRRRRLEHHADKLKTYLKENIERCGITKIKGQEFSISIRKNPPSVIIDDERVLPNDYISRIEIHPDKTKIKAAIQSGETIEGAHIENSTSLIIR